MPKFAHHEHIFAVLNTVNSKMLDEAKVAFGGGTAVTLLLGEYRLSNDIDFICAGRDSYRQMRHWFFESDTRKAFLGGLATPREFETNRYSIKGFVQAPNFPGAKPIKVEIFEEARIPLEPYPQPFAQAPAIATLSRVDFFAEKLLANEDRGRDRSVDSRDLIDLAMMVGHWGPIPAAAWSKVDAAYRVNEGFLQRLDATKHMLLEDKAYFQRCLSHLSITEFTPESLRGWLQTVDAPLSLRPASTSRPDDEPEEEPSHTPPRP